MMIIISVSVTLHMQVILVDVVCNNCTKFIQCLLAKHNDMSRVSVTQSKNICTIPTGAGLVIQLVRLDIRFAAIRVKSPTL